MRILANLGAALLLAAAVATASPVCTGSVPQQVCQTIDWSLAGPATAPPQYNLVPSGGTGGSPLVTGTGLAVTYDRLNAGNLSRAANLYYLWNGSGWGYYPGGSFAGHFAYGEQLLGVWDGNEQLILTFNQPVFGVGFDISTIGEPNFKATITAYDADGNVLTNGMSNLVSTAGSSNGGTCAAIVAIPSGPPPAAQCNDAPYLGFVLANPSSTVYIQRIVITTTEAGNTQSILPFYIGSLDTGWLDPSADDGGDPTDTPEPSATLLIGAGLALTALARKFRGAARA